MFLTTLLAATLAAPVPKEKPPPYHPTTEGTKRVMEHSINGKGTQEITETITKVEEKDGVHTLTVEKEAGTTGGRMTSVYVVSAEGVSIKRNGVADPIPLFKAGAKAGDTWQTGPFDPKKTGGKTTHTIGKEEEVEVPAGKFTAIPVTSETPGPDQKTRKSTVWYARGVGVVKREGETSFGATSEVLKSFTAGKAEKK